VDAETCHSIAWEYLRAGETQLALEHALRAHELKRNNLDFLNTLGVVYGEAGQLDLAEATFRKLLKRKPGFVNALVNLGKALEKQERLDEARAHYERALAIEPAFPKLAANLASIYRERGEPDRSRTVLERHAQHVEPQDLVMGMAQSTDEVRASAMLQDAARQHPEWLLVRNALAHALLAAGEWREGWRRYARPGVAPFAPRLDGRGILLRGEQGIGDVLFFLRFVPALRARGAAIRLACEKKLWPILDLPRADAGEEEVTLGDLPARLDTAEVAPPWPLKVEQSARERLAALGPAPYLAVTWRAGTDTARGREFGAERSALTKAVPPKALGEALRGWRGTTILLQRGARAGDAAQFGAGFGAPFHDLSALGDDLPALLAVLSAVDEYVGVSNTNMHLLAGIGRSARVLVPFPAEWRWLRREGRSPWFPDFPVYRQPASRDWSAPLAALRGDLGL